MRARQAQDQDLSDVDVLAVGLACVGFDAHRQSRVNEDRNIGRFKKFFGSHPLIISILLKDLRTDFPLLRNKDALMTLNWLYVNDTQSVLSGRWGCCEEYIGPTVRQYAKMIQSQKPKKIRFQFSHNQHHKASIDCSTFTTNEFRLDPSSRWFDVKSNLSGLKYEACFDIWDNRCVWLSGPHQPAIHDICVFRGGEKNQAKEEWDRNALYFQLQEGDRLVGDDGYRGEPNRIVVKRDEHSKEYKEFLARVSSRQETFFRALKQYNIIKHRFAYGRSTNERLEFHQMCVEAIAVIVQYCYENGHPPFEVC